METITAASTTIFGGEIGWKIDDWTSSDDRVRGGKSQSYLDIRREYATFRGHLDIKTLGGAGFASQRTTGETRTWDLSSYSGIEIEYLPAKTDDKKYTFILKDDLLLPDANTGREQSSISWEYDFSKANASPVTFGEIGSIVIKWEKFKPTFRGRPMQDVEPLQKHKIKRMSFMMRSFFGTQDGDFSLAISSVRGIPNSQTNNQILETQNLTANDSQTSFEKSMTYESPQKAQAQRGGLLRAIASCFRL